MSAYLADKANLDASYPDGFWILDDSDTGNGWCYWSKLLPKDEATNLLLDNVTLNPDMTPDDNWAYNIDVRLQAANKTEAYKLGSVGGISSEGKALINSLLGLNTIANPQDKFDSGSDQLLNLKPVPGYPGLYEVLDDNGKSARPKEYLLDPDTSVKDDSNLSGDEISVDSSFVANLEKTYPDGLPDSGGQADHIADVNGVPAVVDTDGNVLIDGVNFPDPYLRALIGQAGGWDSGVQINMLLGSNIGHVDAIDSNQDGVLSQAELDAVTNMYLVANPNVAFDPKIANVASLDGLNFFPNLDDLEVAYTQVSTVTPSQNLKLETLFIRSISSVDLSHNIQLKNLLISVFGSDTLDVSHNTNLETMRITGSPSIHTVDISNLTNLTWLQIYDDTPVDKNIVGLENCTALTYLDLRMNSTLTAVDVTMLSALQELRVLECPNVTSINASGLANLELLYAYSNPSMTSLDASGCSALSTLFAYGTASSPMQIATVDITDTPALLATVPINAGFRFAYNGNITITGAAGRNFTNATWQLAGNTITYAP